VGQHHAGTSAPRQQGARHETHHARVRTLRRENMAQGEAPDQSGRATESWWAALEQLRSDVDDRFDKGDRRMTSIQADVAENTRITAETKATIDRIEGTTDEIREFFNTLKSLLKLGNMLSSVTIKIWKPISYVAAAALSIILFLQALKGGK
jgi:hypothetical protein